jgi:phospholipase/lecithinase/hemolysin
MPNIKELIIFGDSLSDVGRIHNSNTPNRLAGVNELGRFSDRGNWVDWIYEKLNGSSLLGQNALVKSRTITGTSSLYIAQSHLKVAISNFAKGGALASDKPVGIPNRKRLTAIALDSIDAQVTSYLDSRRHPFGYSVPDRNDPNERLHLFWAGGNDVLTVERVPTIMSTIAGYLVDNAYNVWRKTGAPVVILDLPSPAFTPRIKRTSRTRDAVTAATNFNSGLVDKVMWYKNNDPRADINLLGISSKLTTASMAKKGIAMDQSQKGIDRAKYPEASHWTETASLLAYPDGIDESARPGVISDELHPTEEVQSFIGEAIFDYVEGEYGWNSL